MTKEEAIKIASKHLDPNNEVARNIVNILEALEVIKFTKETISTIYGLPIKSIINALQQNGYHVYRMGD